MSAEALCFSRARLRRDVPATALRALLLPRGESARAGAGHRLVWTLFSDGPGRERDFLWREADAGIFYLLSRRPPEDRHGLFELDPPKLFAPVFREGERLAFSLRANATIARGGGPGTRGRPCDVVMDALRKVPPGARAAERAHVMQTAGRCWLERQGERCGFVLPPPPEAEDCEATRAPRCVVAHRVLQVDHAGPAARLGILDFEGELEVRDPGRFVQALAQGFGRAKAFGCGLMLVRRA